VPAHRGALQRSVSVTTVARLGPAIDRPSSESPPARCRASATRWSRRGRRQAPPRRDRVAVVLEPDRDAETLSSTVEVGDSAARLTASRYQSSVDVHRHADADRRGPVHEQPLRSAFRRGTRPGSTSASPPRSWRPRRHRDSSGEIFVRHILVAVPRHGAARAGLIPARTFRTGCEAAGQGRCFTQAPQATEPAGCAATRIATRIAAPIQRRSASSGSAAAVPGPLSWRGPSRSTCRDGVSEAGNGCRPVCGAS
jgi:hypothetical protein